ncbi:hypothetical protein EPH95_06995 [Salicibibacter halophilus]|uniref:Intracellular proteinase inhibitor BsuPI domain-containing protein n=1 Tax=Salicibibacter halophilus TaxID=2502791 RepID=A0A514LGI5_9BACI|nr:BsuPI-related putative proteinase inhibitor [Salicibibacter halophilus]QDI90956.1 hypothetical protein EPH95_06995 [Salicibibacter halophilus]
MKVVLAFVALLFVIGCQQEEQSQGEGEEMMEEGLYMQADASETDGGIQVESTLGNGGDEPVELRFNTSQRIEIRLFEEGKPEETVYRSSQEMMYNQVIGDLTLEPGEETTFNEEIPSMYLTEGSSYEGEIQVTVAEMDDDKSPTKPSASFTVDM